MTQRLTAQASLLLLLAVLLAGLRQFAPHNIAWTGKWPTTSTAAEEAYGMMAKPGDPPFIGLSEVIKLQEEKTAVLLDARAHDLFVQGHLPGARSIPFYDLDNFQEAALDGATEDSVLVIYCEGVGCELSFFLGRELTAAGYKNIRIFYGGYPEWADAGLPVEMEKNEAH